MQLDNVSKLLKHTIGLNPASIGYVTVEDSIRRRMAACDITDEERYLQELHMSATELGMLIEEVTVPETWFFRDIGAYNALRQVVAEHAARSPVRPLHLASMPCSTGEEPYSIAMTLLDEGFHEGQFTIDALDISETAVRRAREAVYTEVSFRGAKQEYGRQYFQCADGKFALDDSVKRLVNLHHGNILNLPQAFLQQKYDVVFCRNLLIYLDDDSRKRVRRRLHDLIKTDGSLFVGNSEAAMFMGEGFKRLAHDKSFAFRRSDELADTAVKAFGRAYYKSPSRSKISATERLAKDTKPLQPAAAMASPADDEIGQQTRRNAFYKEASSLADQGDFDRALVLVDLTLRYSPDDVAALFLSGLIYEACGNGAKAAEFYRKVLYLDPEHRDAMLHYALILEQKGENKKATALRKRLARLNEMREGAHGP